MITCLTIHIQYRTKGTSPWNKENGIQYRLTKKYSRPLNNTGVNGGFLFICDI